MSLATRTRELLRQYELRPRKGFGQNFLINPLKVQEIAAAAVEAAELTGAQVIVEIGPGLGALTEALAEASPPAPSLNREGENGTLTPGPSPAEDLGRGENVNGHGGGGPRVVAFEIDRGLEAPLGDVLGEYARVSVRFEDFLEADLQQVLGGERYVVAGNLPYNITAPLLEKLLLDPLCRGMVITVQREVAQRLRAVPGTKDYGPLTLFCSYYVQAVEVVTQLHPGDFLPSPSVDSTAVRLMKRETPPFVKPSAEAFERGVRGAFNHRRKALRSGLALATRLGLDREQVSEALEKAEISGDRRAETLDFDEFARLAQALDEVRGGA